jgi:hypothetical protein
MDLALRFAEAAQSRGLRVLALKGISIADELYGGVENRPMADVDFLVVDTTRFVSASDLARSLGLSEIGASDHALVFKEPSSGVVLELHVSLTACPGLFRIDHDALWERRAKVAATPLFRLSNEDLVVHLALHTAFQHAFAANRFHYGDFDRALETLAPSTDLVLAIARDWGALRVLGAMALSCRGHGPASPGITALLDRAGPHCPRLLSRWLSSRPNWPPPASIAAMAYVRYELAPSKWGYLSATALPRSIPGRTLPRRGAVRRIVNLVDASGVVSRAAGRKSQ